MTWQGIHGHDDAVEQFRRALTRRRLASSFLFVGSAGIGKRSFALKLAQALLCTQRPEETLDPCGACPACAQVIAGTHPDVHQVAKPKDRASIPLDLLIGDKEHRGRVGLCHDLSRKPQPGGRKIAILDDADHLNPEGANCLLKTLEEPPPRSLLILIGTSPAKQLPTIRSRCQLVRFSPLPAEVVADLLLSHELVKDEGEARRLAEYSEGSLQRALELADPELWSFRNQLIERLAEPVLDSVAFSKAVATFVDAAGKQAALRRNRFRQIVGFATEFYRQVLHAQNGVAATGDAELQRFVGQRLQHGAGDQQKTATQLDRCLETVGQIDRNANQTTLIETWLDDLSRSD